MGILNLKYFLTSALMVAVLAQSPDPEAATTPPAPCGLSPIPLVTVNVTEAYVAVLGQVPWQVSVQVKVGGIWTHSCGGTVITKQAVLTSATCIDGNNPGMIRIDAGIVDVPKGWFVRFPGMQKPGQAYTESIKTHPLFDKKTLANNLAVLRLATTLDFVKSEGNITNICMPTPDSDWDAPLFVSGWGSKLIPSDVPDVLRPKLMINSAQLVPCSGPVNRNEICVSQQRQPEESSEIRCEGDLGGSLFGINENGVATLMAVASHGTNCTDDEPYVFTEVFPQLQWIHEASKPYY